MADPEINDLEHVKLFKNTRTINWEVKVRGKDAKAQLARLDEINEALYERYNDWFNTHPAKKVLKSTK